MTSRLGTTEDAVPRGAGGSDGSGRGELAGDVVGVSGRGVDVGDAEVTTASAEAVGRAEAIAASVELADTPVHAQTLISTQAAAGAAA